MSFLKSTAERPGHRLLLPPTIADAATRDQGPCSPSPGHSQQRGPAYWWWGMRLSWTWSQPRGKGGIHITVPAFTLTWAAELIRPPSSTPQAPGNCRPLSRPPPRNTAGKFHQGKSCQGKSGQTPKGQCPSSASLWGWLG